MPLPKKGLVSHVTRCHDVSRVWSDGVFEVFGKWGDEDVRAIT